MQMIYTVCCVYIYYIHVLIYTYMYIGVFIYIYIHIMSNRVADALVTTKNL